MEAHSLDNTNKKILNNQFTFTIASIKKLPIPNNTSKLFLETRKKMGLCCKQLQRIKIGFKLEKFR